MSTGIEWTDETWNPVTGCTKVSQGCKNCYAETVAERFWAKQYGGRRFTEVRTHASRLDQPLHWQKPRRIFVNSMSDLFHEDVPEDFLDHVFAVMALSRDHSFQVLTKRPERMRAYFAGDENALWCRWERAAMTRFGACYIREDMPLPNVWLGVSVEDQTTADERIPWLIQTPAAKRFVSYEPALGRVSFRWMAAWPENAPTPAQSPSGTTNHLDGLRRLDWIIAGGESGRNARPARPHWFRDVRDECVEAGVPFFFKQWGEWGPPVPEEGVPMGACEGRMYRAGKKGAGRELDGRTWDQFPEVRS